MISSISLLRSHAPRMINLFLSAGLPASRSCPEFLPAYRPLWCALFLSWRHVPGGHTPCSRSFNFQGSVPVYKNDFTENRGLPPYIQDIGKTLKIRIFPRLWNRAIMGVITEKKITREGALDVHKAINPGAAQRSASGRQAPDTGTTDEGRKPERENKEHDRKHRKIRKDS